MGGYVIDPFTNAGYQSPVVLQANGGLPTVPQGAPTQTAYSVTKNGTVSGSFNPFPNFIEANAVAQAQKTGLDADNDNWGVLPVQVQIPINQVGP
jgi:hypothetical protein